MKRLIGVKIGDSRAHADGILRTRNRLDGCLAFELPREQMEAFCVRHNIRKLSLFGSVLTPRFRPSSDIDVLVERIEAALEQRARSLGRHGDASR